MKISICKEDELYIGKAENGTVIKAVIFEELIDQFLKNNESLNFFFHKGTYEFHRGILIKSKDVTFTGNSDVIFTGTKSISHLLLSIIKKEKHHTIFELDLKDKALMQKPNIQKWFRTKINSELFVNQEGLKFCSSQDNHLELFIKEVPDKNGKFQFDFDFSSDKRPGVNFLAKHNNYLELNQDLDIYNLENSLLYGFFTWNWADEYSSIQSAQGRILKLTGDSPQYGFTKNQRVEILNSSSFLKRTGTCYFDYENEKVQFCLDTGIIPDKIEISFLKSPFIRVEGSNHFSISGIQFTGNHTNAIETDSVNYIHIKKCKFQYIQNYGVFIKRHKKAEILRNKFSKLSGGIYFYDPKRTKKEKTCTRIISNSFVQFDRYNQTNPPAIYTEINGCTIALNSFSNANSWGIDINGDYTKVFLNKFKKIVNNAGDIGVINCDRNWTFYKNSIFLNFFKNIGGFIDENFFNRVSVIYIDTLGSNICVFLNWLYNCDVGVFINGGSFNRILFNIFTKCRLSLFISAIGKTWAQTMVERGGSYLLYESYDSNMENKEPLSRQIDDAGGIDSLILPHYNLFKYNFILPVNQIHFLDHTFFPYEKNHVAFNLSLNTIVKKSEWSSIEGKYIEISDKP